MALDKLYSRDEPGSLLADRQRANVLDHLGLVADIAALTAAVAMRFAITSQTTTYVASVWDFVLADASGAAFTVTLPTAAASGDGGTVVVKKTDASANLVTVDGDGAETIDGAASMTLAVQWESVTLVSSGTAWYKS